MEYQQLNEILSVDTEVRVHDAASRLIHQIAFAETRKALNGLREMGVIGEPMAVQLAMELNEALIRPIRKGAAPAATGVEEPPVPIEAATEESEPEAAPKPKQKRRKRQMQDVIRLCPICEEQGIRTALSSESVGCIAHWREVKRRKKARGH